MAETAIRMGVSRKDIILESKSADTEDQARLVKPIVGKGRIVLVTSAVHMPRAMALFRKAGMEPVPAPVDYLQNNSRGPRRYLPHAFWLAKSEAALNECLGMAWSTLRGRI